MSKLSKLRKTPVLFFRDAIRNRLFPKKRVEPAATAAPKKPPAWYRPVETPELQAALAGPLPTFLYVPWIAEHTGDLVGLLNESEAQGAAEFQLIALDIFCDNESKRSDISEFAQNHPDIWRKMVLRRLIPLRGRIAGFLVTFDWHPVMRILVKCCQELGIRTVLIPHEVMFFDRNLYYRDTKTGASCPITDAVLCWNDEQRDIFIKRGYDADRITIVGSPKLDAVRASRPQLDHKTFCQVMQLDPNRKICLFACQPMDAPHVDPKTARARQLDAIRDLVAICDERDLQLLVRLSQAGMEMTLAQAHNLEALSENVTIDGKPLYLLDAHEALHHCDLVAGFNSSVLIEAVTIGKPTVLVRCSEADEEFSPIPPLQAFNSEELSSVIDEVLDAHNLCSTGNISEENITQVHRDGSIGSIGKFFTTWANCAGESFIGLHSLDRLFDGKRIDVVGYLAPPVGSEQKFLHLQSLIFANSLIDSRASSSIKKCSAADVFVQWGATPKGHSGKNRQRILAKALARPLVFAEDGFLRSADIGLSGEPTLSIILDDTAAYYDARKQNRLQRLLNEDDTMDAVARSRARAAINKIVSLKVSKYNHAPTMKLEIGRPGARKILVVDQRFGDQSVSCGLADEASFEAMLNYAVTERRDCDIIVKQHPDATKGGKQSYLNAELVMRFQKHCPNIYPISFDVNPYSLFDIVQEVFVVTSGMGFEALMAGKQVHCFGAPFYAGRGLTTDHIAAPFRYRDRSIEDVFYYAYITLSRYYDPVREQIVEVEDIVDHIASVRSWSHEI